MNKSIIVGITGQTGAGKTTICNFFHSMGLFIIDADVVSKEVIVKYKEIIEMLKQEFGSDIVDNDNNLDRRLLAFRAFKNKNETDKLNKIMLPFIKLEIDSIIVKNKKEDIIIIDAPLLFESGIYKCCDAIISVVADYEIRLNRIMKRDNLTFDQAKKRMDIQKGNGFYERRSNFVLDGRIGKSQLLKDAENLIVQIKRGIYSEEKD